MADALLADLAYLEAEELQEIECGINAAGNFDFMSAERGHQARILQASVAIHLGQTVAVAGRLFSPSLTSPMHDQRNHRQEQSIVGGEAPVDTSPTSLAARMAFKGIGWLYADERWRLGYVFEHADAVMDTTDQAPPRYIALPEDIALGAITSPESTPIATQANIIVNAIKTAEEEINLLVHDSTDTLHQKQSTLQKTLDTANSVIAPLGSDQTVCSTSKRVYTVRPQQANRWNEQHAEEPIEIEGVLRGITYSNLNAADHYSPEDEVREGWLFGELCFIIERPFEEGESDILLVPLRDSRLALRTEELDFTLFE